MNTMFIDPKGDNSLPNRLLLVTKKKKVRYKQKKKKAYNILFIGDNKDVKKEIIVWPKNLPKDCKLKGKNYIHVAAEQCDIDMLNKAILDKHDLARHDSFGKNALHYLFANTNTSKLINVNFFKKMLMVNKEAWKPINTYDFFSYFAQQISSNIKSRMKDYYDEDKHKEIMSLYAEFIKIIKDFNLELALISKHFFKIQFNATTQSKIIEDALLASYNKEKCLINLIERVNFFKTPEIRPKDEEKDNLPFMTILDEFAYYSPPGMGMMHSFIMGSTRSGKTSFPSMQNWALEINQNADQEILFDMWKNYILKHKEFNRLVMSDDLFNLMQKYNNILATNLIKDDLENELELKQVKKEPKKIKL